MKLLSIGQDAKTVKGLENKYIIGIMYLSPSNEVKGINTCPWASKGCKKACLYTSGRFKVFPAIKNARESRTRLFKNNKPVFFAQLIKEIEALERKAKKSGLIPVIRLNGTSDIMFEKFKIDKGLNIFEMFPNIQFYDYTKNPNKRILPKNYHITFSRSESNEVLALKKLKEGINVAIVFKNLPNTYKGYKVIEGDNTDLRFLDEKKVIVGLKSKGDAKKDNSNFVVK